LTETRITLDESVFNPVYLDYLDSTARTQIFYGGAASGKSVFLAQRDVYAMLQGGRNFLVCRAVGRTIRRSVFAEIIKVIGDWGVGHLFNVNKTELTITCTNGYQFLFSGLDDVEKLKSIVPQKGSITDIRVEEATETNEAAVRQLAKRQRGGDTQTKKRLTLSFNPIVKTHWIYNKYFKPIGWRDDQELYDGHRLLIVKTWHIHNEFLTPDDIEDLLSETDEYSREVYTLGNWGVLGDTIFKNYEIRDLGSERESFDKLRYGLDFGFGVDPSAFCVTHYDRATKTLYILDEFSATGLTNDALAEMIAPYADGDVVYCDSAEPKSIQELRNLGIAAVGAKKGKGSINHGVRWLQAQKIVIDSRCVNAQNEFSLYTWRKDRHGQSLPVPEDRNNHIIDAIRYQYEDMAYEPIRVRNAII
jgi:phage terminase large subunit